jgi:hypothetical protein
MVGAVGEGGLERLTDFPAAKATSADTNASG